MDDELGRVLVCLRCEAVMPAVTLDREVELALGDDDDT
jgi:hypothetical protein